MLNKLRLWPVALSLLLTASLLFGGWFLYRSLALENPLVDQLQQMAGIRSADVQITTDQLIISADLEEDASLRALMADVKAATERYLSGRNLSFTINNASSPALDQWWSAQLFDIAEAMENKQYGRIRDIVDAGASQLPGIDVYAEMDETYVYLRLHHEQASRFIMLPRDPGQMKGWSNG